MSGMVWGPDTPRPEFWIYKGNYLPASVPFRSQLLPKRDCYVFEHWSWCISLQIHLSTIQDSSAVCCLSQKPDGLITIEWNIQIVSQLCPSLAVWTKILIMSLLIRRLWHQWWILHGHQQEMKWQSRKSRSSNWRRPRRIPNAWI